MADFGRRRERYRTGAASQLPGDVLSEIFLHLRELLQLEDFGRESNLPWIQSTTHVCRAWRRLAISSHLLWTHVIMQSPDVSSLFLERSADLPLDVVGKIEDFEDDEEVIEMKMESIVTCAARTGSLDIQIPPHVIEVLPSGSIPSFPRLVKLSIDIYETGSTDVPLPPFIGGLDSIPQLRELRTVTLDLFEVNPLISKNLRKLELGGFSGDFTCDDFLGVLERLAGGPLEELSLWAGIPSDIYDDDVGDVPSELPSFPRSIPLPRLRSLRLDGEGGSSAVILQHLVIPPTTTLKLAFEKDSDVQDLPLALAAVGRTLLGPPPQQGFAQGINALHIEPYVYHKTGWTISGWKTQPSTSEFFTLVANEASRGRPLTPSIQMKLVDYSFFTIIPALSSGLQLHTVKMLSLKRRRYPADQPEASRIAYLLTVLRQLPSVEILSVSNILSYILPDVLALADGGYDSRVLPLLRILNISTAPADSPGRGGELSSLISSLDARAKFGHRLELIRLPYNYSDTFSATDMAGLRECADTVELHRDQPDWLGDCVQGVVLGREGEEWENEEDGVEGEEGEEV